MRTVEIEAEALAGAGERGQAEQRIGARPSADFKHAPANPLLPADPFEAREND
jgi:hypothetical protein